MESIIFPRWPEVVSNVQYWSHKPEAEVVGYQPTVEDEQRRSCTDAVQRSRQRKTSTSTFYRLRSEVSTEFDSDYRVLIIHSKLEEVSSHKSAKSHAGNVFVTRDLDIWPFDSKINEFPGLMVEQTNFYVEFDDSSCIGFWDITRTIQTNWQTAAWWTWVKMMTIINRYRRSYGFFSSANQPCEFTRVRD